MRDRNVQAFACFFLIAVVFYGIGFLIDAHACKVKSVSFDGYNYGPVQGCMVLHNDRWLPLENIRGFDSNN